MCCRFPWVPMAQSAHGCSWTSKVSIPQRCSLRTLVCLLKVWEVEWMLERDSKVKRWEPAHEACMGKANTAAQGAPGQTHTYTHTHTCSWPRQDTTQAQQLTSGEPLYVLHWKTFCFVLRLISVVLGDVTGFPLVVWHDTVWFYVLLTDFSFLVSCGSLSERTSCLGSACSSALSCWDTSGSQVRHTHGIKCGKVPAGNSTEIVPLMLFSSGKQHI